MFGATDDDEVYRISEADAASEDGSLPSGAVGRPGLLGWLACTLMHRRAHRWYPRYLGGYGCCSACGWEWD